MARLVHHVRAMEDGWWYVYTDGWANGLPVPGGVTRFITQDETQAREKAKELDQKEY